MSINEVTSDAAWLVVLAITALVATGWRKRVRASAELERSPSVPTEPAGLTEEHAPLDTQVSWLRKLWSAVAGFGLAVWVGAAAATVIAFGAAYMVITLTNMLKR